MILNRKLLKNAFGGIILISAFSVAYSQSPLFTSNQNQYFLHGLVNADFGFLRQDWLASTVDPTPLFSKLIEISYRYLKSSYVFYFYYVVLMGLYLYSLLGIAKFTFPKIKTPALWMTYIAASSWFIRLDPDI